MTERPDPAFTDVDRDDAERLVAMMDATDAWPAVAALRSWVLDGLGPDDTPVVDLGCGSGSFGAAARVAGHPTVDVDRSAAMLAALRRRHPAADAVMADAGHLPLRSGSAPAVRAERILQWVDDPAAVLAEVWRVARPGGLVAITDTDWGTFVVDHPDPEGADRLAAAALRWATRPTLARTLPRRLAELGATGVRARADAVVVDRWDPDDPAQAHGPPGLPLRSIADAAEPSALAATRADVDVLAARARDGLFFATLTLVTAVGRRR